MASRLGIAVNVVLLIALIGSHLIEHGDTGSEVLAAQTSEPDAISQRLSELELFAWNTAGLCYFLGSNLSSFNSSINAGVDQLAFGKPEDMPGNNTTTVFQVEYTWNQITAMPWEQRRTIANQWATQQGASSACPPTATLSDISQAVPEEASDLEARVAALEQDVDELSNAPANDTWPPIHQSDHVPGGFYLFDPGFSFEIACVIKDTDDRFGYVEFECERHR